MFHRLSCIFLIVVRVTMCSSEPVIINDIMQAPTGYHLPADRLEVRGGDNHISRSTPPASHSMEIQTQIIEFEADTGGSQGALQGSASPLQVGSPSMWSSQKADAEQHQRHSHPQSQDQSINRTCDTSRLNVTLPETHAGNKYPSESHDGYDTAIEYAVSHFCPLITLSYR